MSKQESYTITSIFMVPTLKLSKDIKDLGFINAYWKTKEEGREYGEYSIFLLFKPPNMDRLNMFIDDERELNGQFMDDYDYGDGYVILVYGLDLDFKKDFDLVMKGKYSKVSDEFKELFPKTKRVRESGSNKEKKTLQWRIFNKTDDMRTYWEEKLGVSFREEMEVWQTWEIDKEILDVNKLLEC